MVSVATGIALGTLVGAGLSGQDGHVFETIGDPVRSMALNMWLATEGPDGHAIGWATYEAPDGLLLLGVGLDDGRVTKVDLAGYGRSHTRMTKGPGGNIYLYSGNPGHFLRYDVTTRALEDLGVPATPANYWLGQAVGPDGRFWVGTYPEATLVSCDMQTGEIQNHGQMRDDDKQAYIIRTAVSDAGIVYNAVGLHHRELWAYDPATGARTQILPEEMTTQQGAPDLWIATDGHVYGKSGAATFRCKPDGIEIDESGNRYSDPEQKRAGGVEIGHIDANGELAITDLDTGETRMLATEYGGQANPIYCVSCERDGKIYGGSGSGSRTFSYDPATGELTDLGRLTSGSIQVYDIVNMPRGLFQSSYMGASMDVYDPDQPREAGKNPVRIASAPGQERPVQWTEGPDGKLYLGTVPVKGHLGGALTQVDPETLESRHWSQIIHNQSIYYVAPVPQTNQLVCATSVGGGSSAIPTEKEACIFIWDIATEEVVYRCAPVPGSRGYGRLVTANTGIVYGLTGNSYYAFDPVAREVVFVGELPVPGSRFPGLNDGPVGERGLIHGVAGDAVFAIDPADHSATVIARHGSLKKAHGFFVTDDEVLYYGSGPTLMRCDLK